MRPAVYFMDTDPRKTPAFACQARMEELAAGLSQTRQEKIRAMKMPGAGGGSGIPEQRKALSERLPGDSLQLIPFRNHGHGSLCGCGDRL